ncbi:hypothetical protein hamaS1_22320 [Moorella sp. Hama-1]|nr:hypothetical protein hamaS1_22320 [Moorella sp. Hama-1]
MLLDSGTVSREIQYKHRITTITEYSKNGKPAEGPGRKAFYPPQAALYPPKTAFRLDKAGNTPWRKNTKRSTGADG